MRQQHVLLLILSDESQDLLTKESILIQVMMQLQQSEYIESSFSLQIKQIKESSVSSVFDIDKEFHENRAKLDKIDFGVIFVSSHFQV